MDPLELHFTSERDQKYEEVSILSQRNSLYEPYHPDNHHQSTALPTHTSWTLSPVTLQQSLPPMPPSNNTSERMSSSIFQSRAVLETPYQEQVSWQLSTDFGRPEGPKEHVQSLQRTVLENEATVNMPRYFPHLTRIPEPWRQGFVVRFPWWGFGALVMVLLLTGASIGILLASEGSSVEDWRVGSDNTQPQVYLSILEVVMNSLTGFALVDGMVIRFWRQLQKGTTLSGMHDTYDSLSLWPALRRMMRLQINVVVIACLLTTLSTIRGPLFQRALTIHDNIYKTNYAFLIPGAILSLVAVVAILPLYNGFWELGRKVSLDPLEIARAFGAPLLEGMDGNATPDRVMIGRGGMMVRYGVVERYGMEKKLRVEEAGRANVRTPWEGEILG